jgi:hypothetical protein
MTVEEMMAEFHSLDADARLEVAFRIWDSMTASEDALIWEHAEDDPEFEESDGDPNDVLRQLVGRVRNARRGFDRRYRGSAEPTAQRADLTRRVAELDAAPDDVIGHEELLKQVRAGE